MTQYNRYVLKVAFSVLWLGLLPLCFGGAHHSTWYFFCGLGLFFIGIRIGTRPIEKQSNDKIKSMPSIGKPLWTRITRRELAASSAFCVSVLIVATYHFFVTIPHPILATVHISRNIGAVVGFFTGLLILITPIFVFDSTDGRLIRRAIEISGIFVALIALGQWFSDDGYLLWTFAPEFVFESTRARWPFVNPNHLAAFMLAPLFISLSQIISWATTALQVLNIQPKTRRPKISQPPVLASLCTLFCSTALIAAQSRTCWFAATLGLGMIFVRRVSKSQLDAKQRFVLVGSSVLMAIALIVVLSLNEQFDDVIATRLNYTTNSSGEDLRLKYFSDSLLLLAKHPLSGVGPGGFAREIETVARPELAGLKPIYLHNDVLQMLVEYGAPVGLLLLGLVGVVLAGAPFPEIVCFIGILVVSLMDFPFRLAALVAQFGIIIALEKTSRTKID